MKIKQLAYWMKITASLAILKILFQNRPIIKIGAVTRDNTVRFVFVKPEIFSSDSGEFKNHISNNSHVIIQTNNRV